MVTTFGVNNTPTLAYQPSHLISDTPPRGLLQIDYIFNGGMQLAGRIVIMSKFRPYERGQEMLIGYCVEDFVEADALCRHIVREVEKMDLRELCSGYSFQGHASYHPAPMLAIWILAYSEGITSSRVVESRCQRDMYYIYASANQRPDHCSLARFRQRHKSDFPELFARVIAAAAQNQLSKFERIHIDGTKLHANASRAQGRKQADLEAELRRVRADIADYLARCDAEDARQENAGPEDPGDPPSPPPADPLGALEQTAAKLEAAEQELKARQAKLKAEQRKDHQINLTDPECRNMSPVNQLKGAPAYNAVAAVDAESKLITGIRVVNQGNDYGQFSAMHQQSEAHLGVDEARLHCADGGFHTLEELAYLQAHDIDAVINDPAPGQRSPCSRTFPAVPKGDKPFTRSHFTYDPEEDVYRCPGKQVLHRVKTRNSHGRKAGVYQSPDCMGCALRARCIKRAADAAAARQISRDDEEHLAEAMYAKATSEEGQARLAERMSCVEGVFGHLKANIGFRRFSLRGLSAVQGEFALLALAYNLKRIWQLDRRRTGNKLRLWSAGRWARAFKALSSANCSARTINPQPLALR